MVGRPRQKVFCQGMTRASQRIGKPRQCRMKGYPLANGTYKCKYHGYQNVLGFKNTNYTDDTRIKQLSKLYQFRDKTHRRSQSILLQQKSNQELEIMKSLDTIESNLIEGLTLTEILKDKNLNPSRISLMKFYAILKKKSRVK